MSYIDIQDIRLCKSIRYLGEYYKLTKSYSLFLFYNTFRDVMIGDNDRW